MLVRLGDYELGQSVDGMALKKSEGPVLGFMPESDTAKAINPYDAPPTNFLDHDWYAWVSVHENSICRIALDKQWILWHEAGKRHAEVRMQNEDASVSWSFLFKNVLQYMTDAMGRCDQRLSSLDEYIWRRSEGSLLVKSERFPHPLGLATLQELTGKTEPQLQQEGITRNPFQGEILGIRIILESNTLGNFRLLLPPSLVSRFLSGFLLHKVVQYQNNRVSERMAQRTLREGPPKTEPAPPNATDPLAIVKWAHEGLDKKEKPEIPTSPLAEPTRVTEMGNKPQTREEALRAWWADPSDKRTWGQVVGDWERSVKGESP